MGGEVGEALTLNDRPAFLLQALWIASCDILAAISCNGGAPRHNITAECCASACPEAHFSNTV
jgi:hypothetical protein